MTTFKAEQFTPTKWESSAQKAKFANHMVKFIDSGFKRTIFPKWFYNRLSMCFGHIAHYNINGFYNVWFETKEDQQNFIYNILNWHCCGDPEYTYSDVEKSIQEYIMMVKGY